MLEELLVLVSVAKSALTLALWENIYLHNGTFHVISTSSLPEPGYVMSASPDGDDRPPAGEDRWRVVNRDQAIQLMGKEAVQLSGTSVSHPKGQLTLVLIQRRKLTQPCLFLGTLFSL